MRVAMLTPMSPESAIADVMVQATPDLAAHWDLDIWCPTEPSYRSSPVPVLPYEAPDHQVLDALSAYDLVVYVFGDSPWHSRILPLAVRLPGLVVLHDSSLTNLVRYTAIQQGELEVLARSVEARYDSEHADILRGSAGPVTPDGWLRFCAEVPLDDVALQGSLGVVVHSRWHARKVEGMTLGDVTVAPLPVPSTRLGFDQNQSGGASRLLAGLPEDALLLVTVGSANANRRIDVLLEALADDQALARIHLWAVGPSEDKARIDLLNRARALGLADRFAVTGRVTDALLQEILSRADLAAALRDPVLEGQSASALTQLLSGTPVMVYDHGHYAELPDDVVLKVPVLDPVTGVRAALHQMVKDPAESARRGARGRDYVLASRSGAAYAAAILAAGARAVDAIPLVHVTADLGERLRRLGLHKEPAVLEAATDLAFDLFDLA